MNLDIFFQKRFSSGMCLKLLAGTRTMIGQQQQVCHQQQGRQLHHERGDGGRPRKSAPAEAEMLATARMYASNNMYST